MILVGVSTIITCDKIQRIVYACNTAGNDLGDLLAIATCDGGSNLMLESLVV